MSNSISLGACGFLAMILFPGSAWPQTAGDCAALEDLKIEDTNLLSSMVVPGLSMQTGGCEPDGKVNFICGVVSPEDLVQVPRSDWVIASGYTRGGVHVVDREQRGRGHGVVDYPRAREP